MKHSLQGLRVLNTRPKEQAQELSALITQAGGMAIECPTIEIQAPTQDWLRALPHLDTVDYAIFISANAVSYCFSKLKQDAISWPTSIKVIAIGQGSAKKLHQYGITVHALPEIADSEHLLALKTLQKIENQSLLLFKGEAGRELIEQELKEKGARLITVPVYKRVLAPVDKELMHSLWRDNAVDIILLTSEQSIRNLFKLFTEQAHHWLQNKPCIVLSERLAKVAASLGINHIIISHPQRMISALFDFKQGLIHGKKQ